MPNKKQVEHSGNMLEHNYPDIKINPSITKQEKEEFLQRVMNDILVSNKETLFFNADESFYSHFLDMFTDFSIPFDEINDVVLYMILKETISSNLLARDLKSYVEKQIIYRPEKSSAIDTVSEIANRSLEAIDKVGEILGDIKDLTKDGKFLKVLPKKKLDMIFEWVQKILNGMIVAIKPDGE